MTAHSEKDFPQALRAILAERDISIGQLAIATGRHRQPAYSKSHIGRIVAGDLRPTPDSIKIIADTLGIDPKHFREYRIHEAREKAQEMFEQVGLEEVIRRLEDRK